jgi:hypothetical protein
LCRDCAAIDVWLGTRAERGVSGIDSAADLGKSDAEVRLLPGCTPREAIQLLAFHNQGLQLAILIEREGPQERAA